MLENNELVKTDLETAEVLNNFFSNVVHLDISRISNEEQFINFIEDRTLKAILKYRKHPSIVVIRNKCKNKGSFSFAGVDKKEIEKEILKLDVSKASQNSENSIKLLKENVDIFSDFVCTSFNSSINMSKFPKNLKLADITSAYKKGKNDIKGNYRPVSILPNLSKIFEKHIFKQMSRFFENILSKYQCGFRKGFSTQHCLLAMLEKWKRSVDNGKAFDVLLTDLSKAFDCLDHELLIAKLNAYGFSLTASKLIHDYLSNRNQRTKINLSYSSWHEIIFGVPHGSVSGPLLFNIFLIDLFFIVENIDIARYANDNTPYISANNVNEVILSLEKATDTLFKRFSDNVMKSNADKCHLLVSTNNAINIKIGNIDANNSTCEKLLGVKFDYHISELCKKASRKIHALARVTPYMDISKKLVLMNAFFKSQFSYCLLVWMGYSRANSSKINRLHERCLRIIYSDKQSSFEELLEKDGSVSIHQRNLQVLPTEMHKVRKGLSPAVITELFEHKEEHYYNPRNNAEFAIPAIRTVYHGFESISYFGPKIWNVLPDRLKNANSLETFKSEIKK